MALTVAAVVGRVFSHPSPPPVDQMSLFQQTVNPALHEFVPVLDDMQSTSDLQDSSLGIQYGKCYIIKDRSGSTLGSDGGVYSYYKFGSSQRVFQVWNTRAYPLKGAGAFSTVPDGGKFFLWDPQGSSQTNGGSWVATNLGGYTYPGFGGYWYYLHFKGYATQSDRDGYAIKLGIAQVEPPSPLSNYKGLKVSGDYIWNQNNEDTIDVVFVQTDCYRYDDPVGL